jgi:hypothetical protein
MFKNRKVSNRMQTTTTQTLCCVKTPGIRPGGIGDAVLGETAAATGLNSTIPRTTPP